MTKTKPIANLADLPRQAISHGETFQAEITRVGKALGSEKLGCSLVIVPPGKKAWPYHLHHANEEMFVVLEGEGTLRYDGDHHPIKAGDVISAKAGKGTAHQIVNSSKDELRYLAISTMIHPEVAEYPDSGKRAMVAGAAPGRGPYGMFEVVRDDVGVDYWTDEA